MSARQLQSFIATLAKKPEQFRPWYGRLIIIAGAHAKSCVRLTGNYRVGSEDPVDVVQDALALARAAGVQERAQGIPLSMMPPLTEEQALQQMTPFIGAAIKRLHQQTRPTRSKFRHQLPWPHPYEPMEVPQLDDLAERELTEKSKLVVGKFLSTTKYNPKIGAGKYLSNLGPFVDRAMNTQAIADALNNSTRNVHTARSRIARSLGIYNLSEFGHPSKKKPPK